MAQIINKTMQRSDLELQPVREIVERLYKLMRDLHDIGLKYSSWVGTLDEKHSVETEKNKGDRYEPVQDGYDDKNVPWFAIWEYAWLLHVTGLLRSEKRLKILDLGGACSPFVCLLAEYGHHVTVLDRIGPAIGNAAELAKKIGWDLCPIKIDIGEAVEHLNSNIRYDYIFSISTMFICPPDVRARIKKHLHRLGRVGAIYAITFDYMNGNPKRRLQSPSDLEDWFLPDKFSIMGNNFLDCEERDLLYYPDPGKGYYTMGALFMQRT